jgi:hypothetical protein
MRERASPARSCLVALLLAACLAAACGSRPAGGHAASTPSPGAPAAAARDRQLAISMVPRLEPAPGLQDYVAAADLAAGAGVSAAYESATWKDLAQPGGLKKARDDLAYAGSARGWDLLFGIKVLDTTVKSTPDGLQTQSFASPQMRQRFHALVDSLKPALDRHVRYVSIGNEVDAYLSAHPDQWDAYRAFYADAVTYVHAMLPGVRVGVTAIFDNARGRARKGVAALEQLSDVVIFTYYPLGDRFVPRPPDTAAADVDEMLRLAGDRPLLLQEVGYPSSPQLASSEVAQAAFVRNVVAAWRRAGPRIPLLNWFALHDLTRAMCDQLGAYYGLPGQTSFEAYLCSLGLRRVDGTPKQAWQALLDAHPAA